jgi:hypothetical protein
MPHGWKTIFKEHAIYVYMTVYLILIYYMDIPQYGNTVEFFNTRTG